ncbi:MAG: aminotransferase class I/II-fold pyridoxal phosphate-dependent enzyme, partial [Nitrospinales bacterium]
MTNLFHQRLEKELARRRQDGLFRQLQIAPPCRVNLSANDYLQLRNHPSVLEGATRAMERFGSSSGASPLLSGFLPCHDHLLMQLLEWKQKPSGLLFNTGFMANQAVLKHLPGSSDLVLVDRLIHHSMAQALLQGKANFKRYHHLDLDHLEELLDKNQKNYETVFVATESVFSMDGDYPDMGRLAALKSKWGFVWILDEAHGTGVFGPTGCGLAEEHGVLSQVDILIGTLGKALASMGGYVLTHSTSVVDHLINYAGELIYSTFLPPAQAGAASAALELARESKGKRDHLRTMGALFRKKL